MKPVEHKTPVLEFHKAFGHPVADRPTLATRELRVLRVKLIAEELMELCDALSLNLLIQVGYHHRQVLEVFAREHGPLNMGEAADALGDLRYVVDGANLVFGFPGEEILAAIHESNMSKLGADGLPIYREDGKILKGPNYKTPTADIQRILAEHSAAASINPDGPLWLP